MKQFSRPAPVLGKSHYVRYAGVVGDFNPIHYDLEHARQSGLPDVISQGPLTYTLALDAIAAETGLDGICAFKARVTAPVFPGTELSVDLDEAGVVTVTDGEKTYLSGMVEER